MDQIADFKISYPNSKGNVEIDLTPADAANITYTVQIYPREP